MKYPTTYLIDHQLAIAARQAGQDLEAAMILGDKQAARRYMSLMYAATMARISARAPCFFVEQGERDRLELRGAA